MVRVLDQAGGVQLSAEGVANVWVLWARRNDYFDVFCNKKEWQMKQSMGF